MFTTKTAELLPVIAVQQHLDASRNVVTDFGVMGSWGILFLCCGATAGQAPARRSAVFGGMKAPTVLDWVRHEETGRHEDEHYGLLFSELIEQWCSDDTMKAHARVKVRGMNIPNETAAEAMSHYLALAITLNSVYDMAFSEDATAISAWTQKNKLGWPRLFFAAGLLLAQNDNVRWEKMGTAIMGTSGALHSEVKALFASFESPNPEEIMPHPQPEAQTYGHDTMGQLEMF